jgi:hypothetical protein
MRSEKIFALRKSFQRALKKIPAKGGKINPQQSLTAETMMRRGRLASGLVSSLFQRNINLLL